MQITVEVSARHLHVSKEHLEVLFGKGYELTNKKELSQPGQYVCNEKVEVIGPKGSLKMSILGPTRKATQVEISVTDARKIGVTAFVRDSGDIKDTAGAILKGPNGEVTISEGVIVASRHIHFSPEEAGDIKDGDHVDVDVEGADGRSVTFKNVLVRVHKDFKGAMHVDTDEGNAAGVYNGGVGVIVK